MTGRPVGAATAMTTDVMDFVPTLHDDFVRSHIADQCVVWSPSAAEPTALDTLATVMLDVVDGEATMGQIATEVHQEIGIPLETAQRKVKEIVDGYDRVGLLTSSTGAASAAHAIAQRELFLAGSTPCSENASRLGTDDPRPASSVLGRSAVACDSRQRARACSRRVDRPRRRGRRYRGSEETPLAFVLTAPQGFKRTHQLVDRSGFVLSEGRGLETGLAPAGQPPHGVPPTGPGHRAAPSAGRRGQRPGDHVPRPAALRSAAAGTGPGACRSRCHRSPRLDVDVRTGRIVNPEIPWPSLAALAAGPTHPRNQRDGGRSAGHRGVRVRADDPAAVVGETRGEWPARLGHRSRPRCDVRRAARRAALGRATAPERVIDLLARARLRAPVTPLPYPGPKQEGSGAGSGEAERGDPVLRVRGVDERDGALVLNRHRPRGVSPEYWGPNEKAPRMVPVGQPSRNVNVNVHVVFAGKPNVSPEVVQAAGVVGHGGQRVSGGRSEDGHLVHERVTGVRGVPAATGDVDRGEDLGALHGVRGRAAERRDRTAPDHAATPTPAAMPARNALRRVKPPGACSTSSTTSLIDSGLPARRGP